jgi:hypothetical protein
VVVDGEASDVNEVTGCVMEVSPPFGDDTAQDDTTNTTVPITALRITALRITALRITALRITAPRITRSWSFRPC